MPNQTAERRPAAKHKHLRPGGLPHQPHRLLHDLRVREGLVVVLPLAFCQHRTVQKV